MRELRAILRVKWREYCRAKYAHVDEGACINWTWYEHLVIRVLYGFGWRPAREVEIRYAVERLGLTEADVRDARWWPNRDIVTIRTHNWRRFDVTGLELAMLWWS